MVRLEVIEMAEPSIEALNKTALFAAVSDETQKGILMDCLKRAFHIVQRCADRALLAGTYRIVASDYPGEINVYMGGTVEAVKDRHGLPIPYQQFGNKVMVSGDYAEVVFATAVNDAEYDALFPVVLKYATALYDGSDAVTLNAILKEVL